MNNILTSFNKLNEQLRYSVLVGFVFVIILLDVVFLILPQMASISDINTQIAKLSDDTQRVDTGRPRINLLRKNLDRDRQHLVALSSRVRPIQEVPMILSAISSIANEFNVKIDQLVPEKKQQELLSSTSDAKYYGLPVVIKARSGYHEFGRFLSKLEGGDFYFVMKDFIIQNDAGDVRTHSFSMTIDIILVDRSAVKSL